MTTKTQTIQERAAEALACFESVKREREGAHIVKALLLQVRTGRNADPSAHEAIQSVRADAQHWLDQGGDTYWRVKDGSPQWVTDLCRKAHEGVPDMLPDDWRYQFIVEALGECQEADRDLDEASDYLEPSIYTADLLAWLSSDLTRAGYCDEALDEVGSIPRHPDVGSMTIHLLQLGQLQEKREVLGLVLAFLRGG